MSSFQHDPIHRLLLSQILHPNYAIILDRLFWLYLLVTVDVNLAVFRAYYCREVEMKFVAASGSKGLEK